MNFLNLIALSLSYLHLCARRVGTETDMHSHQLRPPIKQETREAKCDLTEEEGSQGQRGKQNEGYALSCCSQVREPEEGRRSSGISSNTEVQHLCRCGHAPTQEVQ